MQKVCTTVTGIVIMNLLIRYEHGWNYIRKETLKIVETKYSGVILSKIIYIKGFQFTK